MTNRLLTWARGWLACAVAALASMALATWAYRHGASVLWGYAAIVLPGAVTVLVLPSAVRRSYRWVTVLAIGYVVEQGFAAVFLLAGLTWLLHVSWFTDRPQGAALRLPHIHRPRTTKGLGRG